MPQRQYSLHILADLRPSRRNRCRSAPDARHDTRHQNAISEHGIPQQYLHAISRRSELQARSGHGTSRASIVGSVGRVLPKVSKVAVGRSEAPYANPADARLHSNRVWHGGRPPPIPFTPGCQPPARADRARPPRRAHVLPAIGALGVERFEPPEKCFRVSQCSNAYRAVMIVLVNPKSAKWKHRLPLSILSLAALLEDRYAYEIVDGNFETDLEARLVRTVRETNAKYLGVTVMPGPQLLQAIPITQALKKLFPRLKVIWGGYFPTLHANVVLQSGFVDFV